MSGTFWLTEEQFNKIKPLLPNKPRGVPRVDDPLPGRRYCIDEREKCCQASSFACNAAIVGPIFRPNTAPPRRFITAINAPSRSCLHDLPVDGAEAGVFEEIFKTLAQEQADFQTLMIPSR